MGPRIARPWSEADADYLRDESRCTGTAATIAFPRDEAEVIAALAAARAHAGPVTVQGARTGIAGGAVPMGGHVINLSRMAAIGAVIPGTTGATLVAQPGAPLTAVRQVTEAAGFFFPPDPTETGASIGGMVACNASGALSYRYGPTRRWVNALRLVLGDGSTLALRRGEQYARGRAFTLRTEQGTEISGRLPDYSTPSIKCAAGYYVAEDMDLLDLLIGMEGTLGIITEITLSLTRPPAARMGLTCFFPADDAAWRCVHLLRDDTRAEAAVHAPAAAIEYFDAATLDLLRQMSRETPAFADLPALPTPCRAALYVEYHGDTVEALDDIAACVMAAVAACGGDEEAIWYAALPRELARMRHFRHAAPEAVNLLIAQRRREYPSLTKLGTDMAVPDEAMDATLAMYRDELRDAGLEAVTFGHIGNNHVHVNLLPRDPDEYDRGSALYRHWAARVVAMGGTVAAEHGIGKLKTALLPLMYGEAGVAGMRAVKRAFDPAGLLNPGTLFPLAP